MNVSAKLDVASSRKHRLKDNWEIWGLCKLKDDCAIYLDKKGGKKIFKGRIEGLFTGLVKFELPIIYQSRDNKTAMGYASLEFKK